MIKISDIVSELKKHTDLSTRYDDRYIGGVVAEFIELLRWNQVKKAQINEADEEEEELPIEEPETPEVQPEEIPQEEPEEEPEPEQPKPVPVKKEVPVLDKISKKEAVQKINETNGKLFVVIFTKKNGQERVMLCRTGVKQYTSGGSLTYSPAQKNLIPVYDVKIGNGSKGYRMINIEGLRGLKTGGRYFEVV